MKIADIIREWRDIKLGNDVLLNTMHRQYVDAYDAWDNHYVETGENDSMLRLRWVETATRYAKYVDQLPDSEEQREHMRFISSDDGMAGDKARIDSVS